MVKKAEKPLQMLNVKDTSIEPITTEVMIKHQEEDDSLNKYWNLAKHGNGNPEKGKPKFEIRKGLLYRIYENPKTRTEVTQLMVPKVLRNRVIQVAHDGLLSGRFGHKKTLERVISHFHFPSVHDSVKRYVWSCDKCQRNISKGHVVKAPLGSLPIINIIIIIIV